MEKAVLVAGSGISGIGAVKLLRQVGREVILYDGNESLDREEIRKNAEDASLKVILGELTGEIIDRIEYCVISPGIPLDVPFVRQLKDAGIPIWSEIELAYHYAGEPWQPSQERTEKPPPPRFWAPWCRTGSEKTGDSSWEISGFHTPKWL